MMSASELRHSHANVTHTDSRRSRRQRWPGAKITLRNGARIIDKTWPADD